MNRLVNSSIFNDMLLVPGLLFYLQENEKHLGFEIEAGEDCTQNRFVRPMVAREGRIQWLSLLSGHRSQGLALPKRIDVLKIQRSAKGKTVFGLSGRMEKEHIAELEKLLEAEPAGRRIVLNLKNITLAGQDEIDFFARCEERGITLTNCAPYIREWITRQRVGR
jgi:hypothetical protein